MDDYVVTGKIGGGAQGSIFQVSRRDNGAIYALKVIYCVGQQQLNAAIKEVKCLVALRHPNIVSYEDFFLQLNVDELKIDLGMTSDVDESHDSVFHSLYVGNSAPGGRVHDPPAASPGDSPAVGVCLIMELCSNGDLQGVIGSMREKFMDTGRHPVNEKIIVSWIRQCCLALEYIHSKGFIHRDVKPMNIFFDAQGNVKLGDFGVAATVGLGCHSAVGTPDYLAPERMLQQVYDDKVDIWGLGMIALETITLGNHPMNSRVLDNPNAVDQVVDLVVKMGFSSQIGELIKAMLHRHPADRPSASTVLKRLPLFSSPPVVQGPVLRPRSVNSNRSFICSVCEVEPSTIACVECKNVFCNICDDVRHKHPSRGAHERSKIRSKGDTVDHLSDSSINFPLTPKKIVIPISIRSSPRTIKVPGDCSTLSEAVGLASSLAAKRISVASGMICQDSLILTDALPSSLSIIGESPAPVLEVSSGPFAVHFCSGSGSLVNFTIRHCGKRANSSEVKNGKAPRPTAIRITGGEWQLLNCSVSCREGSGMTISAYETPKNYSLSPNVSGCSFSDIKSAAVVFSEGAQGWLDNNSFQRCGYAALVLKAGSSPKISHNVIQDCSEMGIVCEDAEGLFEGNRITGNRGSGIVLKGLRAQPILLKNVISENQAGILCADHSHPSIQDNDISANQKAGILVRGNSYPTVVRNVINNGVEAGIYVFDNGKGVFSDNKIFNNNNAGVLVTTGGAPEVSQNNVFGNSEGVWVCNGGGGVFTKNELRSNRNGPKDIEDTCQYLFHLPKKTTYPIAYDLLILFSIVLFGWVGFSLKNNIMKFRLCFSPRLLSTSGTSDFVAEVSPPAGTITSVLGVVRNTKAAGQKTRLGLPLTPPKASEQKMDRTLAQKEDMASNDVMLCADQDLPFDDETFAEKVLEMEVEGAIDESWQDQRRAYFDDVKEISRILHDLKVRDICCVDTSEKTSSFDYMMFGTCEGTRHIHLASWAVQEADRVHRISKVKRQKTDESWDVVPVGRILVNLMTQSCREDLSLERKWAVTSNMDPLKVANAPVSEGRYAGSHGLWSLTLNLQDLEDFEIDYCKDALLKQRVESYFFNYFWNVSRSIVSNELKREIELLHLNIRNLRKTYEADKLQIVSKKKRLDELHRVFDELQGYRRELLTRRVFSPRQQDSLSPKRKSSPVISMDLPGEIPAEQEDIDQLRETISFMREENQELASQILKNDALVRLGPHVGTLALRVKRTIDGRKYADLQRREAEAREEVNILSFHLRNEQCRLHQARAQSSGTVKQEAQQRSETFVRPQQVALLNTRLKSSRARLGVLARQRADAAKEEEQLNTKIRKLQDQKQGRGGAMGHRLFLSKKHPCAIRLLALRHAGTRKIAQVDVKFFMVVWGNEPTPRATARGQGARCPPPSAILNPSPRFAPPPPPTPMPPPDFPPEESKSNLRGPCFEDLVKILVPRQTKAAADRAWRAWGDKKSRGKNPLVTFLAASFQPQSDKGKQFRTRHHAFRVIKNKFTTQLRERGCAMLRGTANPHSFLLPCLILSIAEKR
eukprot:gene5960-4269_t